jgi:hypothetical protein
VEVVKTALFGCWIQDAKAASDTRFAGRYNRVPPL